MSDSFSDAIPAYALWVQLATRASTQPIHYRAGDEEAAARSIYSLFQKTRELLEQHREAEKFREIALTLLNVVLRPYTARWHGWMVERGTHERPQLAFRDELTRRMFRAELRELIPSLRVYKAQFAALANVQDPNEAADPPTASLGADTKAGIGMQVDIAPSPTHRGGAIATEINKAEHSEILERRRILSNESTAQSELINATGLALSGGGIRSATYCLGIVQVLVRKKLFAQFDYLSTVSGGGYLGAFLSCSLGTKSAQEEEARTTSPTREELLAHIDDVFQRQESGTESGLLRHLRNNSKYLLNGGVAAKVRIAGLLITGILWNMLMLLPIIMFAALAVYYLALKEGFWGPALEIGESVSSLAAALPSIRSASGMLLVYSTWAALGVVLLLPLFQKLAHGKEPKSKIATLRRIFAAGSIITGCITSVGIMLYIQPALFYCFHAMLGKLENVGFHNLPTWLATALAGSCSIILGILAAMPKANRSFLRTLAIKSFIFSGPAFLLLLYLTAGNRLGIGTVDAAWDPCLVLALAICLGLWSFFVVNINTLAPHVYYRSKLCECYLVRRSISAAPGSKTKQNLSPLRKFLTGEFIQHRLESLQQLRLTEMGINRAAPYHLINTTLNVPGSKNKELRGREGDFFLISKHFCGAPIVGYTSTDDLQKKDPHLDLGTAMAVSGAAASTSMGWKSLPNFRFLMTLLNIRLGYWLRWSGPLSGAGTWYFFREMMASMNERGHFLNLSDGGHIENLGAYELLRRRCKFIVCVDGGQEPGMECSDLIRLQRYAEIDLGIQFQYGTADLALQPSGFSKASAILVKIVYAPAVEDKPEVLGWMLYVKLALTGVEPAYVLDYRRENPAFPHQSTSDQFYDEAQFEAYRRLGECAAENLFREELFEKKTPDTIERWIQGLANNLLSDNDPVFRTPQQAIAAAGPRET